MPLRLLVWPVLVLVRPMRVLVLSVLAHGVILNVDGAHARDQSLRGVVLGTRVHRTLRNFSKRVSGGLMMGVPDQRTAFDIVSVPALHPGPRNRCGTPLGRQGNNALAHQPQHDVQTNAAEEVVRAQAVVYTTVRDLPPVHQAAVSQTGAALVTDRNALFKSSKVPRNSVLICQGRHQSKRVHKIIPFSKRHVLQRQLAFHIVETHKRCQP
jgi:hypothetical protein